MEEYIRLLDLPDEFDGAILKKAYRKKVMKFHPDKAKNEDERAEFETTMKKLNEANEYLKEYLENHNGKYIKEEETKFSSENHSYSENTVNEEEYNYQDENQEDDKYQTEEEINDIANEDSEEDIQDDDLGFDDLAPAARVLVCIMLLFQPKLLYKILTQTKANPYKIIVESPKNFIIFIVLLVLILLPIHSLIDKVTHNKSSQQQEIVQKKENKKQEVEEKKIPSKSLERPKDANKTLTLEQQKEIQNYMANIQRNIKANWDLPQNIMKQEGYDEIKVVIAFHIAKDGSLLDKPIIKESSGLKIADIRCIEAVELTAPFRRLPSFINDESMGVEFTFEANRKNN